MPNCHIFNRKAFSKDYIQVAWRGIRAIIPHSTDKVPHVPPLKHPLFLPDVSCHDRLGRVVGACQIPERAHERQ